MASSPSPRVSSIGKASARLSVSQARRPSPAAPVQNGALLLIDVINDLDFPNWKALFRHALPAARRIAALKERAERKGLPVIYVNDNFGRWRSDFRQQVTHCLHRDAHGREITRMLRPGKNDYFVLKPKHSGFFSTSLDILLSALNAKTLILTGFSSEICVLYTANDAYMRGYQLYVPRDCVAAESARINNEVLGQMERCLKADTRRSGEIDFG